MIDFVGEKWRWFPARFLRALALRDVTEKGCTPRKGALMKMVQYSRGLSLQSTVCGNRPVFLRRGGYAGAEPLRLVKMAMQQEYMKKGTGHKGVSKRWLLGMVACALLGGTILGSDDASAGKWRWVNGELNIECR